MSREHTEPGSATRPDHGFSVSLPPVPTSVSIARSIVRRITTFVDDDAESSFLVALTEVVSNAVDEHVRTAPDDAIALAISTEPEHVISVTDQGAGMDTEATADQNPDVTSDSGRGLALARAFVPSLSIESSPSGTVVSLPLRGLGIVR